MVRRNETVGNRWPLCVYNNMHAGTEVGGGKSVGLGGRGREPSLQHKRKKGQNQVKSSTDELW